MRIQKLPVLLKVVESVFGRRVLSYTECNELSEAVFKKTGTTLNVSTLRRVFGLVPAKHSPSAHTLHTLARYCGYASFDELVAQLQGKESDPQANSRLLQYLILLFKDTEVPHIHDVTYINLVKHTIHFLNQEPQLVEPFQKAIAKTKNGQDFYFEQFFNIDRLASFYGEGLRYYLAEKKTPEAQVFGYALLCSRAWLVMDDDSFYRNFKNMTGHEVTTGMHPANGGRYFGAQLLKSALEKEDMSPVLKEAKQFLQAGEACNPAYRQAPHFELTFSTNLVLAGEWGEALWYCNAGLEKLGQGLIFPENQPFFHAFYLFKAMALFHSGHTAEARELYQKIDVHWFYFLAKKYLSVLYLHLETSLKKGRKNHQQIVHLVQEIGFTRLQNPSFYSLYSVTD